MKSQLTDFLHKIKSLGGDARPLVFEPTATPAQVLEIEKDLAYPIPADFRDALLNISSRCHFSWFLPDDFDLPEPLREIFSGELEWDINAIASINEDKDGWVKEVFPDNNNEYDKVWHQKFVFQKVPNGDFLSIDLLPETYGQVVYLSHDDGDGHGKIMASSFSRLLQHWPTLGCTGPEDWQWLPFYNDSANHIDATCENATLWLGRIGY